MSDKTKKLEIFLRNAVDDNDCKKVNYLLKIGADMNLKVGEREIPLFWYAFLRKADDVAYMLIEKGADVSAVDRNGENILFMVNGVKFAEMLYEKGVNVNQCSRCNNTPILEALYCGRDDMIDWFLEKGVNVDVVNNEGNWCLMEACKRGDTKIIKRIIEYGCDVNIRGYRNRTALFEARDSETVKLLVGSGIDINAKDEFGQSVLEVMMRNGKYNIFKSLVESGADVNIRFIGGGTPLMFAVKEKNIKLVKYLIENGGDINCKNDEGKDVVEIGELFGSDEIKKVLLEKRREEERKQDILMKMGGSFDKKERKNKYKVWDNIKRFMQGRC